LTLGLFYFKLTLRRLTYCYYCAYETTLFGMSKPIHLIYTKPELTRRHQADLNVSILPNNHNVFSRLYSRSSRSPSHILSCSRVPFCPPHLSGKVLVEGVGHQ